MRLKNSSGASLGDKVDKVIVILGPTATGKTSLSVELALRFNGEIVSADSMQIYRGMDLGTAKSYEEEKKAVKHHLIDIVDSSVNFSLADYLDHANQVVRDIISRGKLPIIVGGTGLYISSFTDNLKLSPSGADPEYRIFLKDYYLKYGPKELKALLRSVDSESFIKLYDNDFKRIARALETYRNSGKTIEQHNRESKQEPAFDFIKFGLSAENREFLYSRINNRVDRMMENGFLDEAKMLYGKNISETASQAIGYRQLFDYLNGLVSLEDAVNSIKLESRRYAKRQLSWFRRDKSIIWHNIDTNNSEEILNSCSKHIDIFLKM